MMTELITLPKEVTQPAPPKPKQAHKPTPPRARVAKREGQNAGSKAAKPNPNAPKLEASTGPGSGSGPVVDNSGNGKAGVVPVAPPVAPPPVTPTTPPQTVNNTPPPAPVTPPVAPPAAPVVVAAAALDDPDVVVPDDLYVDDTPSPLHALVTVHADGTASIDQIQSSGIPQLDQAVLDTVKHWTFKPGTIDGKPVDSFLRLTVQFTMS